MMIYPPITELVKKTGSRYSLVIETAKRTRQLVNGAPRLSNVDTTKEVTVAVNEIYEGKIEAFKDSSDDVDAGTSVPLTEETTI